jgi:hypothetical protein
MHLDYDFQLPEINIKEYKQGIKWQLPPVGFLVIKLGSINPLRQLPSLFIVPFFHWMKIWLRMTCEMILLAFLVVVNSCSIKVGKF